MIAPEKPIYENFRLEALQSLHILDTNPEKEFDDITALAAQLCDTSISLISLIDTDRQWFKSSHGLDTTEIPRVYSFCAHAILQPNEILEVSNTTEDIRFKDNPLTKTEQPILFYTGVPLIDKNKFALGTLCVIDQAPKKKLSTKQLKALKTLANQIVKLFELKQINHTYEHLQEKLKNRNESLRKIGRIVCHDIKGPIASIVTATDLLQLKLNTVLDEESLEYFRYIKKSSFTMSTYINNILSHYESAHFIHQEPEDFYLNPMLQEIERTLNINIPYHFTFPKEDLLIHANKSDLDVIFKNLITNSIRYNDKEITTIIIQATQDDVYYYFTITDNGMGIPEDKTDAILKLFTTANMADRNGVIGNGIGLSTVKKTVQNMDGIVTISSTLAKGTTVNFSIKKQCS